MRPRSVVIVGASERPGSLGASVLNGLEQQGFSGDIHLINPNRSTIGARPCLPNVEALPMGVDAAVLAIPRAGVLDAVRGLAKRAVGAVVIFASGYAEGGAEGLAEQKEIARIAREANMIVEGPNCLGLVNFVDKVSLTFIELPQQKVAGEKRVSIISQSGAMAAILATTMISRDVPVSGYVSTGNEAFTGVETFLEHFVADKATRVIGMIVEQFRDPPRFLAAARAARDAGKQIVLLHPGRSAAARESAATHTGAMAGDYDVMKTHVERAGVIVVDTLEELGDVVEIALRCPALPRGGVGVLAESGAFKAMTLDFCEEIGVDLPPMTDADSPALRAAMPDFVAVSNPLDLTAQALVDPGLYPRTLAALVADPRVDAIAIVLIQTVVQTSSMKFSSVLNGLRELKPTKPVLIAGLDEGGGIDPADIAAVRALGVPYLPSNERLFRAIRACAAHEARDFTRADVKPLKLAQTPKGVVPEYRAKELLAPLGVPFPQAKMARDVDEALAAAEALGFPVVLKAQSADLSHKSDAGGVIVGLANVAALKKGWKQLHDNIAAKRPGLKLDGVLVEKMGARGVETILGVRNDPEWGPTILIGMGGVTAELMHDVRLIAPDLTKEAIKREFRALKLGALFDGYRGSPALDLDAAANVVMTLGRLLAGEPGIREIDLNPLVILPAAEGVVALDALMLID
jgi:acyl-CoA synthetase (NDP forming)